MRKVYWLSVAFLIFVKSGEDRRRREFKNAFLGLEYRCHTLMKGCEQSRDEMEKQYKAGMKSLSTFTKYRIGCDNGEDNIFGNATFYR